MFEWLKRKKIEAEPVADMRIDARDHQWIHDQRQGTPKVLLKYAGLQTVPKWCHPGQSGKTIICPECGDHAHVYHFAWTAVTCDSCGADVPKHDWYLAASNEDGEK